MHDYDSFNDPELQSLWQKGDEGAFDALYERYVFYLVNVAAPKVKDLAIAKDIVQEVMLKFYLQKDSLKTVSSLRSYLSRAVRNQVFNYKRDQLKNLFLQLEDTHLQELNPSVVDLLSLKETQKKIDAAVASLPEQCRKVFLLSRHEEYSNRQIAELLGISINTVEQHMRKALRLLRENLDYNLLLLVVAAVSRNLYK